MSQQELLKRILEILETRNTAFMVTGSVTSSLQGDPQSTHDIDVVVDLAAGDADRLLGGFPPGEFHVSDEAIREAVARRSMFKVIDLQGGDKVGFWIT
jgi:hypothetical protein